MIVSKDNDFQQMSFVFGHPPKVIWIRRGNCSVRESESILRTNSLRIHEFETDPEAPISCSPDRYHLITNSCRLRSLRSLR